LLPDAHVGNVASLEGLRDSISDGVEGFGLDELFVEAPVDPEVDDSTKLMMQRRAHAQGAEVNATGSRSRWTLGK
jgi:hypothetical protein